MNKKLFYILHVFYLFQEECNIRNYTFGQRGCRDETIQKKIHLTGRKSIRNNLNNKNINLCAKKREFFEQNCANKK